MGPDASTSRRRAGLALLALVPIPSIAVLMAMWISPGAVGGSAWAAAKVWIVIGAVAGAAFIVNELDDDKDEPAATEFE